MRTRKHLRVPLPIPVRVRASDMPDFDVAKIRDISWGGLFVVWDKPVQEGDRVIIQLLVSDESVSLEIWGTVVRVEKTESGFIVGQGIEFDEIDDETRSSIQKMVSSNIQSLCEMARM